MSSAAHTDPRFVCRREGHVPAVRFANMKASGVEVPTIYFTTCVRCGQDIEVELPKEGGTYGQG